MRFKVGDVVVLLWARSGEQVGPGFRHAPQQPGSEGVVVRVSLEGECHVAWQSGITAWATPQQLAPKRPPATELGSWHEISRITGWHPEREVA